MRIGAADSSTRRSPLAPRINNGAAADVERRAGRQRLPHRLGQQLAIGFLDHARDLIERLAGRAAGVHPEQPRGGQIQVFDACLRCRS